jgi:hypothetical protein
MLSVNTLRLTHSFEFLTYSGVCLLALLQVGRLVPGYVRQLVASIAPNGQQLVAAFGIPDHLVAAPIAGQWELYNTYDNQGELTANRQ